MIDNNDPGANCAQSEKLIGKSDIGTRFTGVNFALKLRLGSTDLLFSAFCISELNGLASTESTTIAFAEIDRQGNSDLIVS